MALANPVAQELAGGAQRVRPVMWTAFRYLELFGWTIEHQLDGAALTLGRGMVGVVVPEGGGPEVAARLHLQDAGGPALAVRHGDPCWVFLADPNGQVTSQADLPPEVRVLDCPARVPVPAAETPSSRVRWAVPPDPRRRWLPSLAAVLSAIHNQRAAACHGDFARGG